MTSIHLEARRAINGTQNLGREREGVRPNGSPDRSTRTLRWSMSSWEPITLLICVSMHKAPPPPRVWPALCLACGETFSLTHQHEITGLSRRGLPLRPNFFFLLNFERKKTQAAKLARDHRILFMDQSNISIQRSVFCREA